MSLPQSAVTVTQYYCFPHYRVILYCGMPVDMAASEVFESCSEIVTNYGGMLVMFSKI